MVCSDSLDTYEAALREAVDINVKGRLGIEERDGTELKAPHRIVRIDSDSNSRGLEPGPTSCGTACPGHETQHARQTFGNHRGERKIRRRGACPDGFPSGVQFSVSAAKLSCPIRESNLKVSLSPDTADAP